jgi:hypothetical protein
MEHCMRQTVIALRLADLVGASDRDREATYYLGLLMNVYCHADAAEQARWFGDDISFKGDGFEILDMSSAQAVSFILRRVGSHGGGIDRARRLAAFPNAGLKQMFAFLTTHSTLAGQFAERIGLDEAARAAILQAYEQWDGKGHPDHLRAGRSACRRGWFIWPARWRCSAAAYFTPNEEPALVASLVVEALGRTRAPAPSGESS